ncbi:MAG: tyrosine-type recombinase/integrase [Mycobacteriales bacterium]
MSAPLVPTKTPGIFKRGSRYAVRFRGPDGRIHQRSVSTVAEARAIKSALTTDVRRGEYRELSRTTFAEYSETWLDTYQGRTARGIRPATLADYRKQIERHALPYFGRLRLAEIEPRDVKGFAKAVGDRGVGANTVRLAVAPVRALFATAVEEGLIRSNPATGVRLARVVPEDADYEQVQAKALTEAELSALLDATAPEWRLFVVFVAHTGLRISEAIAVQWADIDFGTRRLKVSRRWYRGSLAAPKSRFGRRSIPLTESMIDSLWARRKLAPDPRASTFAWPTANGTPHHPANLHARVLKPAARAAGVPWVGWHTLRHTCGSILFRHGANAKQVQAWLGHHSPAFTLATYVHLLEDDAPSPAVFDAIAAVRPEEAPDCQPAVVARPRLAG